LEHTALLLHTAVHWLIRGKVPVRLFELRAETFILMNEHKFNLAEKLNNSSWIQRLEYLADIFTKMNELNLSLQGTNTTIFNSSDKVTAMK
jgi:hypothetical protein